MLLRSWLSVITLALLISSTTNITAQSREKNQKTPTPMTVDQSKQALLGNWKSIATEVRPSRTKTADGSLKPFYLTRSFAYLQDDAFALTIINSADAYGKVPLVRILLKGHIQWQGAHPISTGVQKVEFIADETYEVTPLLQGFADAMNQVASAGFAKWEVNGTQSILKKAFVPFGLAEGQVFSEFDLIYILNDMLFWGARHVDGRGFDTEANRPTNLQIPLIRN